MGHDIKYISYYGSGMQYETHCSKKLLGYSNLRGDLCVYATLNSHGNKQQCQTPDVS